MEATEAYDLLFDFISKTHIVSIYGTQVIWIYETYAGYKFLPCCLYFWNQCWLQVLTMLSIFLKAMLATSTYHVVYIFESHAGYKYLPCCLYFWKLCWLQVLTLLSVFFKLMLASTTLHVVCFYGTQATSTHHVV